VALRLTPFRLGLLFAVPDASNLAAPNKKDNS